MKPTQPFSLPIDSQDASVLAEHLYVYAPERALAEVSEGARRWYTRHVGMLFPYQTTESVSPTYYGGLTVTKTLFVLIPLDLVHARRWHYLRSLATYLGIKDQKQLEAYCTEAIQEVLADPSPREHPAFEADAFARQVTPWVQFLACRQAYQTPDWRW